jgi:assimilatory nitrate reductase catalytic subunit
MPDQALVRAALERCELVVLQEAFAHTATRALRRRAAAGARWARRTAP